jgi:hypothetical protein
MNKKILKIIFGMCLIIMLLFYIGAEENSNNSRENYSIQEENASIQNNPQINLDSTEINQTISQLDITQTLPSNETEVQMKLTQDTNQNISENKTEIKENITTINNILPQESSGSESSSSGRNSGKETYYVNSIDLDLNKTTPDNNVSYLGNTNNIEQEKKENICFLYDSLGKKVVEIKDCEEEDISSIEVQRLEKNEFEKEVIISSQDHLNKSVILYTSLTTETKEENIQIYWKNNENLDITNLEEFSVEYYDENENGLIDKISWIVPHLSEQRFEIRIGFEKANESSENIVLIVNNPPSGEVSNPINLNVTVNYSKGVNCTLNINGIEYNSSDNFNYNLDLSNGDYNWLVNCSDVQNASIWNATLGNFSINESFSVSLTGGNLSSTGGRLYFLDLVENKIKYAGIINIHSENPSKIKIELKKNNIVHYTQDISGNITDYFLPLNKTILNQSGIYNLTVYFDKPSAKNITSILFSVASANLTFNTTNIQEGQSVKITANIISSLEKITHVLWDYGDGTLPPSPDIEDTMEYNNILTKKYSQNGQYIIKLTAFVNGIDFTIQKNGINVTDNPSSTQVDTEDPKITLINPEDNEEIYDQIVNFSYKASDNIKIQNCTFKLYDNCASMNYCSTSDSNLIFPTSSQQKTLANNYSVQNNKNVLISLKDFKSGIYEWLIECYDNSSNYDWEIGFFKIINETTPSASSNNYTQKNEVESLKKQADAFLVGDFNLEEREVIEDLNILNDTKYYKKRLTDIGDFLGENYKYVSSEALREQKTNEYLEELENIKNKIPQSITIKESNEYIKNSIDVNLEEVIKEYFDSTNTKLSKSSIQKLAKINKELQNELSVSVKVKNVEIEYKNWTQKITLVKKEIKLNDDSYSKILEIVPKEIAESADDITFLTENKIINEDPIFEMEYGNLEKGRIVYYLSSSVKLKDIEKTETLLFEEDLSKFKSGFTGFFVIDLASGNLTTYIVIAFVLLIALLFIIPFAFKKFRMLSWKREPNVVKVLNLIEEIKKLLKEREIEMAREKYYKIKEIYPVLPYKTRAYFYKKINEVSARIDRKDIFGLVKEYQEAKRKWNKEDYMRLYEDIKKIYERLPEKDRKKVYDIINGY